MSHPNPTQLVILAWLLLATPALSAKEALSLRATPQVANAPAHVSVTVTVERHTENRELVVVDDSEDYYRSSVVQLEGEKAARTYLLVFRGLPPGQHRISATVRGQVGQRAIVRTTVTVVGTPSL